LPKEFADVHNLIGQVAKDYQYRTIYMPNWISELWEKFWRFIDRGFAWLFSKLAKLFSGLRVPFGGMADSGKWRIIIFLGVLLIAAIVLVIWQQKRSPKLKARGETLSGNILAQPRTSEEWRQRATEYREKALYREACRSLHRSCLQMFDEAKLISFAPARSNYEYMRTLTKLPVPADAELRQNLCKTFQTFSNTVDAIYFGGRPAGEAEFEICLKWLQSIESCVRPVI
jgi:hypothetical protein